MAVVALSMSLLSACDASPTVATVNGTRIKQAQLYQNLKYIADSPGFLGQDQSGKNVPAVIDGSYSKQVVTWELTQMITSEIVHQQVVGSHQKPSPPLLQAARSAFEGYYPNGLFYSFPAPFRDELVAALADRAQLEQPINDPVALQSYYQRMRPDFYEQVCVRQVDAVVNGSNGAVDDSASLAKAKALSSDLNSGNPNATGQAAGSLNCYSQAQLEARSPGFRRTVMSLAPGHAADPQKSGNGYTVIAVQSRKDTPYDTNVQKVITALALQQQPPNAQPSDTTINSLLAKAKVSVQPAYGTWQRGSSTSASIVKPPRVPKGIPLGSGNVSSGSGQGNS